MEVTQSIPVIMCVKAQRRARSNNLSSKGLTKQAQPGFSVGKTINSIYSIVREGF
ncbi:hypothetical protein NSMS1_64120 (plasmid) [Nostoc sp. MS1]|nr:hypothetical protein NSMS1_64120 [Nostoc sp. MS1]